MKKNAIVLGNGGTKIGFFYGRDEKSRTDPSVRLSSHTKNFSLTNSFLTTNKSQHLLFACI